MIDPDIINALPDARETWNEEICSGLATTEIQKIPARIDAAMRSAFASLGPELKYKGYKQVDPKEQYNERTRSRLNKNHYEQSKSSTTMYRYELEFNGEKLRPRYQYLPYVDYGGIMTLRDSRYVISPTVTDTLFSVEDGKVFIPITRSPVTFYREGYYFNADNMLTSVDTYWSRMHHTKKDEAPKSRHPQIMNYFFSLYGVTDAFRFMGYEVAVMMQKDIADCDFPEDEWIRCTTTGMRPKTRMPNYQASEVCLLIKRDQMDRTAESIIGSFFYIVDNCSDLSYMVAENMDDPLLWRRCLSRFIWRNADPREAIREIDAHIMALEEYIDEIFRRRLKSARVEVGNIWELFRYVICNYNALTITSEPASMKDKKLAIIEPVSHDIIIMINRMMFALQKLKEQDKWRKDAIEDLLNRGFKQNVISGLASDHPEVSLLETATPSMLAKVTSLIYRPSKNTGSATAADMHNPMFWLHGETIGVFSPRSITKSSPTASNRVNPNIRLGVNNEIEPDPDLDKFREEIERLR